MCYNRRVPTQVAFKPLERGTLLLTILQDSLTPSTQAALKDVSDNAEAIGMPLYLVGGSVRDLILGRPIKDLDLVVEGDATQVASELGEKHSGKVTLHPRFGTATISLQGRRIDQATARRENYIRPGALPEVVASGLEDDLSRRDFSINAMALPLTGTQKGELIDLHGGQEDLAARSIRVLHDDSFSDDPTRMLRAIRYEGRLDFSLEEVTSRLLLEAVEEKKLTSITGDRIRRELELIFLEEEPVPILQRAGGLGVLDTIYLPMGRADFTPLKGISTDDDPLLYLGAFAYPLEHYEGEVLISRLYMPNSWASVVRDTISIRRGMEIDWVDLPQGELAGCLDRHSTTSVRACCMLSTLVVRDLIQMYLDEMRQVKTILNGDDLITLGFPPGPAIGEVLRDLRYARVEGRVASREDELRLAEQYLGGKGG
ncbi:MAG: CCA tRNA nucleotidyltransferase [Dehalococcoidia bacterium]|nr:CCA tRNA nucleotidyltransferase [Dehalococcoidia bacterium]